MEYEKLKPEFIETKNGKVHVLSNPVANGVNLIFLHGMGASTLSWKNLIPYIDSRFGIFLIDLLGHGDSDAPHITYTPKLQAEAVLDVINNKGLKNCTIVGNSYGGWIAAYGCANSIFGDAVSGLLLEDSAGLKSIFYDEFSKTRKNELMKEKMEKIKKAGMLDYGRYYVIESIMDETNDIFLLDKKSLECIKVKTLIVWGSNDNVIPVMYAKEFAELIPNSELGIIEGANHIPHHSKPEMFAKFLERF